MKDLEFFSDTACMAEEMNFTELFDHIGQYIQDKELRWRHVMRIKRALRDPNAVGGYGNDQIYFEGIRLDIIISKA